MHAERKTYQQQQIKQDEDSGDVNMSMDMVVNKPLQKPECNSSTKSAYCPA